MTPENIAALKEYFNHWLEAGEQAYAEVAFTDEYSRNFGGLVNALLSMRRELDGRGQSNITPAGTGDRDNGRGQSKITPDRADGHDNEDFTLTPSIPPSIPPHILPMPPGFAGLSDAVPVEVGPSPRDEVHREDKVRLYRYKPLVDDPHAVPVLIVYALVNRPYIMDLQDGRSLVQGLLKAGLDVYLLDWGCPDADDAGLTLDDYISRYLDNSVDFIRRSRDADRVNLLGVCQGGTFCLCYTALRRDKVANLVTSVTPVDFHTPRDLLSHLVRHVDMDLAVDVLGNIPGEFLNWLFLMLRPYKLTGKKYLDALDILDDSDRLATFMRMEKWIFDSPDQAGAACRQFAKDFYQGNKLVKGEVEIGGNRVDLEAITIPVLNIYAASDHLVPVDASKALAGCVSSEDYTELELPGGHIGIYVGAGARETLPAAINDWLRERGQI